MRFWFVIFKHRVMLFVTVITSVYFCRISFTSGLWKKFKLIYLEKDFAATYVAAEA